MGKSFLQGAVIITVASIISKILGSIFRIPLQNIAGDEVFGIFTIVYPVYMAILILAVAGIPTAVSKLISEARVSKDYESIRDIFLTSRILAILFGVGAFIGILVFSESIAHILGGDYTRLSLMIVSATLLIAPPMAVYRGFFQGFGEMSPTAISQVIEQFVRVGFILVFAYVLTIQGYAVHIVAAGVMVGSIFGAVSSAIYLRARFSKTELKYYSKKAYHFKTFKLWSKKILMISLPICIGALTMALINFIDSVTVPRQLAAIGHEALQIPTLYSYYGRGQALVQIAVVFAQALTLPLIPLISGAMMKKDFTKTRAVTEKALRFIFMTAWPATIGLVVLTVPINFALFGDYQENNVLAVIHLSALFTAIAVLTTGILQGMNRTVSSAFLVIAASILKIILNLTLIEQYGLLGVAYSTLIVYVILCGLNLWLMKKTISFSLMKWENAAYAFSAIMMGLLIYLPMRWIDLEEWSRSTTLGYVAIMILLGAFIYGVLIILLRGISKEELRKILPFQK